MDDENGESCQTHQKLKNYDENLVNNNTLKGNLCLQELKCPGLLLQYIVGMDKSNLLQTAGIVDYTSSYFTSLSLYLAHFTHTQEFYTERGRIQKSPPDLTPPPNLYLASQIAILQFDAFTRINLRAANSPGEHAPRPPKRGIQNMSSAI